MSTILITGCGSGFGFRLARALHAAGHVVIATDPTTEGLEARLGGPSDRLRVLPLDVRSDATIQAVVANTRDLAPIDVLVNNAGFAVFGTQEETPLSAIRDMFEVNVFGLVRVTQALLPQLRESGGTVVQLSSVAGRMVFPESGFYAASKYSVEAISEALWQETRAWGVKVRLIEPGSFATRFPERAAQASPPRSPTSPYATVVPEWDAAKAAVLESGQDPDLVVRAILASLGDPATFLRIPVGIDSERILDGRDQPDPDAWTLATNEA